MNYGGPGELVSEGTGFRLSMGFRGEIVSALRATLEGLAADPSSIRAMGARARERVLRLFTWEAKAAQVLEVYRWVLKQRDMPDFGMPFPDTRGASIGPSALEGAHS
jgi:glycosyltransferase involved in cell wall biosynthesis